MRLFTIAGLVGAVLILSGCELVPEAPEPIPPERTPDTPDTGRLGDAVTIEGEGTELRVVATRVLDPAPSVAADRPLEPGGRFVGVRLRVRNIGDERYASSLGAGARLLTTRGPAPFAGLIAGPCERSFGARLVLAPGEGKAGCISFEVKRNARPQRFTLALEAGFGREVGVWRLRSGG